MKIWTFCLAVAAATTAQANMISHTFEFETGLGGTAIEVDAFDKRLGKLTSVEVSLTQLLYYGLTSSWSTVNGSEVYQTPGNIYANSSNHTFLNGVLVSHHLEGLGVACWIRETNRFASNGVCSDGTGDDNRKKTTITELLDRFTSPKAVEVFVASDLTYEAVSEHGDLIHFEDPEITFRYRHWMSINYYFDPVKVPEPSAAMLLFLSLVALFTFRSRHIP